MRYFTTTNASRRYRAGDYAFTFDPVENIGGTWFGMLSVSDEEGAAIAAALIPQIAEVTAEEFELLKKKPPQPNSSWRESHPRPAPSSAPLAVVGVVAAAASTSSSKPAPTTTVLKTKKIEVPDELKFEAASRRK